MKGNTLVVMDRYGVKHIAPYSFHHQITSGKNKDGRTTKRTDKQEAKVLEHNNKRK